MHTTLHADLHGAFPLKTRAPFYVSLLLLALLLFGSVLARPAQADDGYRLWLRYDPIGESTLAGSYREALTHIVQPAASPTYEAALAELDRGLRGLLGVAPRVTDAVEGHGALILGTPASSPVVAGLGLDEALGALGPEGYLLRAMPVEGAEALVVAAQTDIGVLYGTFHLLRLLQTHQPLTRLNLQEAPRVEHRVLNHWDNLDGTVERGYAGFSLWDWHKLPDYLDPRYTDYARANASLGINGTVLTNVNANAWVLTPAYLAKAAALADVFRPYGLRVYLTARFSAPIEIGGLPTADPLDPAVQAWWQDKVDEIYQLIPDFGGFLVKANSEGQPGPQDYDRSHAEGANLLADALAPHGGLVMWRAFVYSAEEPEDRAKQAYNEFVPLDGTFRDNVLVQVKNGPIDFQPREPFHPLFGAMPETPLVLELQITKEYLGFATHLSYLGPLFEEAFDFDTYVEGPGSTVARVVDGSLHGYAHTAVAGVTNIGTDRNWSGSHFDQANWYAFGRLAWDPGRDAASIARTWTQMTWTTAEAFVDPVVEMMMGSREATVDYMTPLGLHHLMGWDHHYGPGPWIEGGPRADWTSVYYHRADSAGIGFDRSASGSDAVSQYAPPLRERWGTVETTPENLLLWFHHLPWTHEMRSGRTLWEELIHHYDRGVAYVREMQATWAGLTDYVDAERHAQVTAFLNIHANEAQWWRDSSLAYWQHLNGLSLPDGVAPPPYDLEYYKSLSFPYAPGI